MVAHTLRMALTVDDHTVEMDEDGKEALALFESGARLGDHWLQTLQYGRIGARRGH